MAETYVGTTFFLWLMFLPFGVIAGGIIGYSLGMARRRVAARVGYCTLFGAVVALIPAAILAFRLLA